ncbi:hypothetical protein BC827DRAFT_1158134 [Russula dissimulans]|nr:hypothetical protein BC827DRAFT_1158134 [Russula dissimulans]
MKLEDERCNQLANVEDRVLATHTGNGTPAEGEVDEGESGEVATVPVVEVVLTCYRWFSTLCTPACSLLACQPPRQPHLVTRHPHVLDFVHACMPATCMPARMPAGHPSSACFI